MAEEKKTEISKAPEEKTLVPVDKYLKAGVHIGTKFKSFYMKRYIFKRRPDGLFVMDIQTLDERIRAAAKLAASFPKEKIIVVSRKLYGKTPINEFADAIGAKALTARFVPGTFTNPGGKEFVEAGLLIATEPDADAQAIEEASSLRAPIIALCSTNNETKNIDLIIPVNNKGRKSLALVYWLLARELLKERGEIKSDEEFKKKIEDFEFKITEMREEDIEQKRMERRPLERRKKIYGRTGERREERGGRKIIRGREKRPGEKRRGRR
ncbi:MAG: 30S ribosomal protein S2 [Candidatus Diapherotrites archaeon]